MPVDRAASTILVEVDSTDSDTSSHSNSIQIRHLNQSKKVFLKYVHSCCEHRLLTVSQVMKKFHPDRTGKAVGYIKLYIVLFYIKDACVLLG